MNLPMVFQPFMCDCGGTVTERFNNPIQEYRKGVWLPLPPDSPLATCDLCGETYHTVESGQISGRYSAGVSPFLYPYFPDPYGTEAKPPSLGA